MKELSLEMIKFTNVTCQGGAVSASAVGGHTGKLYRLSSGILNAGAVVIVLAWLQPALRELRYRLGLSPVGPISGVQ